MSWVKLELDQKEKCYTSTSVVSGAVVLYLASPLKVASTVVTLNGVSKTKTSRYAISDTHVLLRQEVVVSEALELSGGFHRFYFDLNFPHASFVPLCGRQNGHGKGFLKNSLENPLLPPSHEFEDANGSFANVSYTVSVDVQPASKFKSCIHSLEKIIFFPAIHAPGIPLIAIRDKDGLVISDSSHSCSQVGFRKPVSGRHTFRLVLSSGHAKKIPFIFSITHKPSYLAYTRMIETGSNLKDVIQLTLSTPQVLLVQDILTLTYVRIELVTELKFKAQGIYTASGKQVLLNKKINHEIKFANFTKQVLNSEELFNYELPDEWVNLRIPDTIPSFTTCNIARDFSLRVVLGGSTNLQKNVSFRLESPIVLLRFEEEYDSIAEIDSSLPVYAE